MDEWADADDPKLRALCQYRLRAHVRHQDGRDSLAPSVIFADADYEVADGTCGLHADAKSANEPAIVYFRGDALIDATDRIAELEGENEDCLDKLETALDQRDTADARAETAEGSADYWHQESRIQFEAKNKARKERDEAVQLLIYMVNHAAWREENEGVFWEATEKTRAFLAARQKGA